MTTKLQGDIYQSQRETGIPNRKDLNVLDPEKRKTSIDLGFPVLTV